MNDGPSGLRTWMQLRTIGNSPAVRASVLFPIIGYLILFNDRSRLSSSRLNLRMQHQRPGRLPGSGLGNSTLFISV
jgi:hypothetical protein